MRHGNHCRSIIQLFVFSLVALAQTAAFATPAGGPGEPQYLGEHDASLFVVGRKLDEEGNLIAVRLVWVPKSIETQCIDKTYQECWNLDGQNSREKRKARKRKREYPFQVLEELVFGRSTFYPEGKRKVLNQFSQLSLMKDVPHEENAPLLLRDKARVDVKLEYIDWPGRGEQFEVMEVKSAQGGP